MGRAAKASFLCELRTHRFQSCDEMAEFFLTGLTALLPHTSPAFQEKIEQGARRYAAKGFGRRGQDAGRRAGRWRGGRG